jgi:hypothetical protein
VLDSNPPCCTINNTGLFSANNIIEGNFWVVEVFPPCLMLRGVQNLARHSISWTRNMAVVVVAKITTFLFLICLVAVVAVRPPVASRVCVDNNAGFDLHWALKDLDTNNVGPDSGSYPIDQTRCLEIKLIADVEDGDLIQALIHADGGVSHSSDSAVIFKANSTNGATFSCTGTTLDYSCALN